MYIKFVSSVPAGPVKGDVIVVHGFGEHIGRYAHIFRELNAAGYACHGMDHQGHGASEGDRLYFEAMSVRRVLAFYCCRWERCAPRALTVTLFFSRLRICQPTLSNLQPPLSRPLRAARGFCLATAW